MNLVEKELKRIDRNILDKRILVGFSGGSDSVVLFDCLKRIYQNRKEQLAVCHVNYHLRGEDSNRDEEFSRKASMSANTPFYLLENQYDDSMGNLQSWARDIRFQFYNRLMAEHGYHYVALGHHANDQVETVLQRIVRGTGIKGLGGMRPNKGKIIRPLLKIDKGSLMKHIEENSLDYRTDRSNEQEKYVRNKIRKRIIPVLNEINSNAVGNILNLSMEARSVEDSYEKIIRRALLKYTIQENKRGIVLNHRFLLDCPNEMKGRLLKGLLETWDPTLRNLGLNEINDMIELYNNKDKFEYDIKRRFVFWKAYGKIGISLPIETKSLILDKRKVNHEFYLCDKEVRLSTMERRIMKGRPYLIPGKKTAMLDYDKIDFPLTIGNDYKGLTLKFAADGKSKKISDILIDKAVPRFQRYDNIYFHDNVNNVVFYSDGMVGQGVRVDNDTKIILKIEIKERI